MEVTEGEEDSTAVAEDSTEAVAEEDFMEVEVSTPEATQGMAADTTTADIVVATMEDGAITEVAAVTAGATAGAEDIGPRIRLRVGLGAWVRVAVLGLGTSVWLLLQPMVLRARPLLFLPVLFGSQQWGR